jgi:hypothetical protein
VLRGIVRHPILLASRKGLGASRLGIGICAVYDAKPGKCCAIARERVRGSKSNVCVYEFDSALQFELSKTANGALLILDANKSIKSLGTRRIERLCLFLMANAAI